MKRYFLLPLLFLSACDAPRLEAPAPRYPTKLFGAPFSLRPGQRLDASELVERLGRLQYMATGLPSSPGTYRKDLNSVEIYFRGFSRPIYGAGPARVTAVFEEGILRALKDSSGADLPDARLEPELIYEFTGPERVRREPSRFERLPRHLLDAVVAVEDRRFYRHWGVDLRGTLRAAWRDLRARKVLEGGSTITQQLARSLYLSPKRTFWRKLRETGLAVLLEARYSKDDILRLYLDQVYFGQDGPVSICGVQAAARFFFDKPPEQLSLGESALRVALLASPYQFNPFRDPDRALGRRRVVLALMREQGFITPSQEQAARLEPVRVSRVAHQPTRPADFFVASVQEELERRYPGQALVTYGMSIYTTLDPWLQERAQRAVSRAKFEAALVALDPATGAVRALVGGKDYAAHPFNRATAARRQPGSAFKPFVYGAALRAAGPQGRRWTPATFIPDKPERYPADGRSWTPRNYDGLYRGMTTVRQALALSLNAPTVHIASELGTRRIIDYARALGIKSDLRSDLGVALGSSELSLFELTAAYTPFADEGLKAEPYSIEGVVGADGDVLEYRVPRPPAAVISPEEAWLVTELLRGVVRGGTARTLSRWGLENVAAGKTGTTNDGKDAWFVGYVPGLVCGVWTGQDIPTRSSMTGASHALPIWADFISAAAAGAREWQDPWPKPAGVVEATLDPVSGLLAVAGCPTRVTEYFLPDTAPTKSCPLHSSGVVGWLKRFFKR